MGTKARGIVVLLAFVAIAGCAQPRIIYPQVSLADPPARGRAELGLDMSGDGRADYVQLFDGPLKRAFRIERNGSLARVDWQSDDLSTMEHLILILDGLPFALMDEMWQEGSFRLFHRPGRMIGPFPSLTDVSLSEVFHVGAPLGYEACYYDRCHGRLSDGAQVYLSGANEPWVRATDYRLSFIEDAIMYLFPGGVFKRELAHSRRVLDRHGSDRTVLYILSTDGLAHRLDWETTKRHLRLLDRWLETIVYDRGARIQVTMFGDHGNTFVPTRRLELKRALKSAGLRPVRTLRRSGDVAVPEFGLINFAQLCVFDEPTKAKVVSACRHLEGVELVVFRDRAGGPVRVLSGSGEARVHRRSERDDAGRKTRWYRYERVSGDALELAGIAEQLACQGKLDAEGFARDEDWLMATFDHRFPDCLARLDDATAGAVENPADVLLSLRQGWHAGDPSLGAWVELAGTHGALDRASTNSFVMSTMFESPPYVRPADLPAAINRHVAWRPKVDAFAGGSFCTAARGRP